MKKTCEWTKDRISPISGGRSVVDRCQSEATGEFTIDAKKGACVVGGRYSDVYYCEEHKNDMIIKYNGEIVDQILMQEIFIRSFIKEIK